MIENDVHFISIYIYLSVIRTGVCKGTDGKKWIHKYRKPKFKEKKQNHITKVTVNTCIHSNRNCTNINVYLYMNINFVKYL